MATTGATETDGHFTRPFFIQQGFIQPGFIQKRFLQEGFLRQPQVVLLALSAALVLALAGCVGGGGGNIGNGVDFALSVSPGSQAVTAGNSIAYSVTVRQTSGLGPLVQLSVSGLPPGTSAAFSDSTIGPGTSNLVILTANNQAPGRTGGSRCEERGAACFRSADPDS